MSLEGLNTSQPSPEVSAKKDIRHVLRREEWNANLDACVARIEALFLASKAPNLSPEWIKQNAEHEFMALIELISKGDTMQWQKFTERLSPEIKLVWSLAWHPIMGRAGEI